MNFFCVKNWYIQCNRSDLWIFQGCLKKSVFEHFLLVIELNFCLFHRRLNGWPPHVTTLYTPSWTSLLSTTRFSVPFCWRSCTISSIGAWSRTMNSWPAPVPTVWRTWSSPTGPNSPRRFGIRPVHVCWIYSGLQYQQSKSIYAAVTTCNLSLFNFDAEMISCIKILHYSDIDLYTNMSCLQFVDMAARYYRVKLDERFRRRWKPGKLWNHKKVIHSQSFKSFAQSIKSLLMYVNILNFSGCCLYGQQSRQSSLNEGGQ